MRTTRTHLLLCLSFLGSTGVAAAQVEYELKFAPGERESWQVEARFPNRGGDDMDFWIARWTAGAYHLADFGRFVEDVTAEDGEGEPLDVQRESESHYVIASGDAEHVVVRYRGSSISRAVFTDGVIDVESNRITPNYAYVTPVSLFGFVPELVGEQVGLRVELPAGWSSATALEQDDDGRFHAPTWHRFEDSPLLFGPELSTSTFEFDGVPHSVTVVGKGPQETARIAKGCRRLVESASELLDGLPYSHYHFLFGFVPEGSGSGLEHSFSTLILVHRGMRTEDSNLQFWSLVAHEFFHTWCAERIHVEGLHRADYTRPFETATIWVNEGITEYFTHHVLLHAGFIGREQFLEMLGGRFPGTTRRTSWTDVSRAATDWTTGGIMPFVQSMYDTGPKVIFALDLEMRRASKGERGVVDLLRFLRTDYVDQDRGFPEGGMMALVSEIAGEDLGTFHTDYIDGKRYPDVGVALAVIGYEVRGRDVVEVDDPTEEQLAARTDFFEDPR